MKLLLLLATLAFFGYTENDGTMKVNHLTSCNMIYNKAYTLGDTLQTGWYYVTEKPNGIKRHLDKDTVSSFINPVPIMTVYHIEKTEIVTNSFGNKIFLMRFDEVGKKLWSNATLRTVGGHLAFIVDNKLIFTAKVNGPVTEGVASVNRGKSYEVHLENIKTIIDKEKQLSKNVK